MKRPIRIGLALSGGTAKSVAHIGVLKALLEADIEIERIAGTSGGSIVAAYYAAGLPVDEIAQRARKTKLIHLGGFGFKRLGFLSSDKLYDMVTDAIGEMTFAQLQTPLSVVATNLQTGTRDVIEEGVVARAAQASSCIPQIYAPVEMNGHLYVDGGLTEYMPARVLCEHDLPLIVGVNLGYHREPNRPRHILGLIMQTMGIVAQHNAVQSEACCDVVIKPDLRNFSSFEIKEAEAMIQVGYDTARAFIPEIEATWHEHHSFGGRLNRWWRRGQKRLPRTVA